MAKTPTFSAEGAGMFKEQYGRNPKTEELQQFVAGTFNMPTKTTPTLEGEVINRPVVTPQTSYDTKIQDLQQSQKSEEQIRQEQLQQAQAMIDATNEVYQQEMGRLQEQGRERLQETRSIGVGAGLAGSPFQTAATSRTQAQTEDILAARRAERQAQIAQIRAQAMGEADKKIQQQLENFRAERQFLTTERDTEIARRAAEQQVQRETALGILGTFGSQGISASEIPVNEFRELLDQSGLSEFAASAYIDANKPQPEQSYQVANGKLIGYSVDPITGKVKVISEDIPGLESATEANIQTFGGVPYVISTDADGNVSGQVLPGFQSKATGTSGGGTTGTYTGYTPTSPIDIQQIPIFDEFIQQKQEELGMSIANPEDYRDEYEQLAASEQEVRLDITRDDPRLSGLSALAREAVLNPAILSTKTATQRGKLEEEIFNAGFTSDEIKSGASNSLRNEFVKNSNEYTKVRDAYNRVQTSSQGGAAGDLSLIFNYMKMLDPGSVVRETEFANAQNAAGVPERVRAQYNRIKSGEYLTEKTRADFVQQASKLFRAADAQHDLLVDEYERLAENQNVDPENVIVNLKTTISDMSSQTNNDPLGIR